MTCRHPLAIYILPPLLLLQAGCAAQSGQTYPSLAKRPFENAAPVATDKMPLVAGILSPDLSQKLSALEGRMSRSSRSFYAELSNVERQANAARSTAPNSDAWVAAHVEISGLDRMRADGIAALAELDVMIAEQLDRELRGDGPLYAHLLKARQQELASAITAQAAEVDRLARVVGM